MNCPKCGENMEPVTFDNIEVDRCSCCKVCYGAFLDAGELSDIKERTLVDFLRDPVSGQRS
jgi:Zn-finger nucleic acid-binding protein